MPKAGYRSNSSAGVGSQGTYGYYWSSSRDDANDAYNLYFSSGTIIPQIDNYRASGFSVRPFKYEAVQPDDSRTKLY